MPPGMPPALFPPYDLTTEAVKMAEDIRTYLTISQRRPIVAYGRCLITSIPPTHQQTIRFVEALRLYAPYRRAAHHLGGNIALLQSLQHEIARRVAGGV